MKNQDMFDDFSGNVKMWKMQPRVGESSKMKVWRDRKGTKKQSQHSIGKHIVFWSIFEWKLGPKMSPNGAEKPIEKGPIESMKKTMKNDAKMDPNMEQKGSQKRAKNPTSSRHIPDTPPRREKRAKMEPKWSQKGAKREPKTMENQ